MPEPAAPGDVAATIDPRGISALGPLGGGDPPNPVDPSPAERCGPQPGSGERGSAGVEEAPKGWRATAAGLDEATLHRAASTKRINARLR